MKLNLLRSGGITMMSLGVCLWIGITTLATAAPFTEHLDPLIAELQARSAALTGTTNKIEIKQKKAIDKVLASFDKESLSILTDLKLVAKAAKSLAKAFPEEFMPAPEPLAVNPKGIALTNLDEIIQVIVGAFDADLALILVVAQDVVDAAPDNPCKDKAQATLDKAAEQMALLPTAPDNATAFKILQKAAKDVLKGATQAELIAECKSSSGGGGGGSWYDWTVKVTLDGNNWTFYENALNGGPDFVNANYYSNGYIEITASDSSYTKGVTFGTNIGNPGGGTHPITGFGYYYEGGNIYPFISGTITVTKWPSSLPGEAGQFKATFSFTANGPNGIVSGTNGSITLWLYPPF